MKFQVKNITPAQWKETNYFKATLVNESGEEFTNIAFWAGEVNETTTEIEGELTKNDKGYWKFVSPRPVSNKKPNMERVMEKKAGLITEAQAKKAQSISDAQRRNEIMWAKVGACNLVANHPAYKNLDARQVQQEVIELAGKILTGDLIPF